MKRFETHLAIQISGFFWPLLTTTNGHKKIHSHEMDLIELDPPTPY